MKRLAALFAFVLAGCTTVSNGPMQRVLVDSEPRGAVVLVRNCGAFASKEVKTPGVAWVSRRSTQCELVFRKPYYEEQRVKLRRRTARSLSRYGTAADILFDASNDFEDMALGAAFMLPSFAIDAASGAMFELQPSDVFTDLVPARQDWRDGKTP